MIIKEYEVIINEKNATCGLVVNLDFYKIEPILREYLQYEVLDKENKIRVISETGQEIYFINLSKELIYYAYKTINLLILGGRLGAENKIEMVAEAILI